MLFILIIGYRMFIKNYSRKKRKNRIRGAELEFILIEVIVFFLTIDKQSSQYHRNGVDVNVKVKIRSLTHIH